ncbi:MAG: alpha-galactosidase [Anaerolineales bacterium]
MHTLPFDHWQMQAIADKTEIVSQGYILHGTPVFLQLPIHPRQYYCHGWQSWSLTTWLDPTRHLPAQKPALLHPLQTDPLYANHPAPNGSWLGAVELENDYILLLGALGLEAHVALHDRQLHGWYETGSGAWFVACGPEKQVFSAYAHHLQSQFGAAARRPAPRVWCSWYSLYTAIEESLLHRTFDALSDLPFDVLQVDDGWQTAIGDWTPNGKFPSGMEALAAKIRASGRTPGLWLAPLVVLPSSALFRRHPDWLLRNPEGQPVSAGFNWGEPLYALDTTHPAVLNFLANLMKQVRAWGYDYLKLDFLYAGALPGKRYQDMPRETALRHSLKMMREAMGSDAYFLACGAPILPCLGLCDALRIGPDVAGEWENPRDAILLYNPTIPAAKNALRTALHRLWLAPLIATDPDVAYFCSAQNSLSPEQKQLLQDLALICHFKATSDLPQWLDASERQALRTFLEARPAIHQTGRYTFQIGDRLVDFGPAISMPPPPHGLTALKSTLLGWLANQRWALKLFHHLNERELQKMIAGLQQ